MNVNVSSEHLLMTALMRKYDSSIRPVYNSSKTVRVLLGLTLTQILDLDEKNQVLTTNVWLEMEWYDEKLTWNTSEYGGLAGIRVPCRKVWLPDIVLYNSVDDYTSGYMPSLAMVYDDGNVFWGPVVRFRSSCKIDITFFPFDDQDCKLKLGSWAYHVHEVDVHNRSNTIDLSNFVDNGEWELIGVKVERNMIRYNCCKEPFPDVTFYVRLRRRVKYYFMNIIIPCIILSFLCLAGFLLPPESGEKITLGLSVLLTITVFMLMVADKMPQTSESIPLISIYLMIVLSISCLSILSSVWILSIHHQRGKPTRVPTWIKILVFKILAPILCLTPKTTGSVNIKHSSVSGKYVRQKRTFHDTPEIIRLVGIRETVNSGEESEAFLLDRNLHGTCDHEGKDREDAVNELIAWLQKKYSEESCIDGSYQEWRDVALVLDRLLFVAFLVITIVSTAITLGMRPDDSSL
ncbi:hypothetical protein ACJMK2_025039 [Sinanodonta woodiana]|uniref:Uncharacterized protein n=1 Tax=Sinanodonta woodiana TaxID=1069815 RepID=A0ABD3XGT3_SINWO